MSDFTPSVLAQLIADANPTLTPAALKRPFVSAQPQRAEGRGGVRFSRLRVRRPTYATNATARI
ncbi:MAG: hypothetical protein WCF18_21415, partial [Chthoniobacteraceae bacterium]